MSDRLERVREAFAALNRGDYEEAADYTTEDVELRPIASATRSAGCARTD